MIQLRTTERNYKSRLHSETGCRGAAGIADMYQLRHYCEGLRKMNGLDLATVLQSLYDSEINGTITTLRDVGYDFALISYLEGGAVAIYFS
jgi:hypothetical protein